MINVFRLTLIESSRIFKNMKTLPATIEQKFSYLEDAKDDQALYEALLGNRSELAHFMMQAAEDETWSFAHPAFFKSALTQLTQSFFGGRLEFSLAQEIVQCLYAHHSLLHEWAPETVKIVQGENTFEINPLYLAVNSPYFLQRMRTESGGKEKRMEVDPYPKELIAFVIDYLKTNDLRDVIRFSEGDLTQLLKMAEDWEVKELGQAIEKALIKFIPTEKIEERLVDAIHRRRILLAQGAIDLFNRTKRGSRLFFDAAGRLGMELFDLEEWTLDSFDKVRDVLEGVKCKTEIVSAETFSALMLKAPSLEVLDFSESMAEPLILSHVPRSVREIDCSRCIWLDNRLLDQLSRKWEGIEVLKLAGNSELTYAGFSGFHLLKRLKRLDLTNCRVELQMVRQFVPQAAIVKRS